MEKVVEYIVKELVENKEAVEVSSSVDGDITIINVKVDSNDLGKVIGKQGKTANAIRTIVKNLCGKEARRSTVKFSD